MTQPLGEVGVTQLQDLLVEPGKAQIRAGDRDDIYGLVDSLSDQGFRGRDHYSVWRSNCIPLVERIIAASEKKNGPGSGRAAPVLLPHTFRLKRAALSRGWVAQ